MIDKKISLGTVITILTILATCIYTQGIMSNKVDSFENDTNTHSIKINKNIEAIQELEVSVAKIESKIDEGFKRLETLLIEN
tara:strand:- start:706 stop:951 length:246 start_codon:yes stop_codon:yes gene_type:complete